ncbi:MAG: YihY/virulence factor BrkB family protein [Tabrizicola sp.]|nr:YihY/virulence factor BrkB family protein [Tabrizicola sp.]
MKIWHFAVAIWNRMGQGHFGLIAAGVAFYGMFAVFPGLTATISIWSLMADPAVITDYLAVAERFLPTDAAALVHDQVIGLLNTPKGALGWATFVSLSIALYSARAGVAALIQGLDVVHRATPRNFLWGWAVDFLMTGALITAFIVALTTIVVVPILLTYFTLGPFEALISRLLPWGSMFLLVLTCLGILYRFGPNMPDGRVPWVTPGTLAASIAWAGVSIAFSTYLSNFDSYNRIYGSIGAVIALLMWLYLSVLAVLLGGAINAELTERTVMRKKARA